MSARNQIKVKKFHLVNDQNVTFLTAETICNHCQVSKTTAYKWIKEKVIPHPYAELLKYKVQGFIDELEGFRAINGELITRNGYHLNASDLETYGLMTRQIETLLKELDQTKNENKRLRSWLQQSQPQSKKPQPEKNQRTWWKRLIG